RAFAYNPNTDIWTIDPDVLSKEEALTEAFPELKSLLKVMQAISDESDSESEVEPEEPENPAGGFSSAYYEVFNEKTPFSHPSSSQARGGRTFHPRRGGGRTGPRI
uniref:hypothetical protein n=1 Tax=Acinetobacter pittii TaxID=48296 RepID=UPI001A9293A1